MKTPRFEELAKRYADDVDFHILFSREAHPNARNGDRLSEFADELAAKDKNGDHAVTFEEFGGPREMFDPFDVDHDGVVHGHELLSATKIHQFADVQEPTSADERVALAKRFREQVPGGTPVLLDDLENSAYEAYGKRPNSAFVIDAQGKVTHKFEWASVREVDAALAELLGTPPRADAVDPPDFSALDEALARARDSKRPLLVEMTAPGCGACKAMKSGPLTNTEVLAALDAFERTQLSVDQDAAWNLFEGLELDATPAFVVIDPKGPTVVRRHQGFAEAETFAGFLSGS